MRTPLQTNQPWIPLPGPLQHTFIAFPPVFASPCFCSDSDSGIASLICPFESHPFCKSSPRGHYPMTSCHHTNSPFPLIRKFSHGLNICNFLKKNDSLKCKVRRDKPRCLTASSPYSKKKRKRKKTAKLALKFGNLSSFSDGNGRLYHRGVLQTLPRHSDKFSGKLPQSLSS